MLRSPTSQIIINSFTEGEALKCCGQNFYYFQHDRVTYGRKMHPLRIAREAGFKKKVLGIGMLLRQLRIERSSFCMGEKPWRAELAFCILKFHGEFHKYRLKECGWKPLRVLGERIAVGKQRNHQSFWQSCGSKQTQIGSQRGRKLSPVDQVYSKPFC